MNRLRIITGHALIRIGLCLQTCGLKMIPRLRYHYDGRMNVVVMSRKGFGRLENVTGPENVIKPQVDEWAKRIGEHK